jgi:hypothetical protein
MRGTLPVAGDQVRVGSGRDDGLNFGPSPFIEAPYGTATGVGVARAFRARSRRSRRIFAH